MEILKKDIIIESSISRVPGLIPTIDMGFYTYKNNEWCRVDEYNGDDFIEVLSINDFNDINKTYFTYGLSGVNGCNGNWGKIPLDIDVTKINDEKFNVIKNFNMPYVKEIIDGETHYILRHKTMMELYYKLYRIYNSTSYYKLCRKNGEIKWIAYNNSSNIVCDIYNLLPLVDDFKIGDIIGVNENFDYVNNIFGSNRNDLVFTEFVEKSIGILYIDNSIKGQLVPEYLYYSEVKEWYDWLVKNSNSEDCCVKDKYIELGGDEMKNYLSDKVSLINETVKYFKDIVCIKKLYNINNLYPYINIPIYISSNIDDMGEYSLYSKEWVNGNRYYVGDTVIYVSDDDPKGSSYILKRGDKYELIIMDDEFYNSLEKSNNYIIKEYANKDLIDEACNYEISEFGNKNFIIDNKKIIFIDQQSNICYMPLAYYCGFYDDKNREIYFDDVINGEIVLNHWEINSNEESIKSLNSDGYNENWPKVYVYNEDLKEWSWISPDNKVKSKIESKLNSLKRYKKSYDDDGNELPGVINYIIKDGVKEIDNNLEFIFLANEVHNLSESYDDVNDIYYYHGDIIDSIQYSADGIEFNSTKDNANYIKFIYYIGVQLFEKQDNEGNKYWSIHDVNDDEYYDGTKYEEIYNISIGVEKEGVKIDDKEYTIYYDEIDFNTKYCIIYSEELDFAPIKTIFSNAISDSNQLFSENIINNTFNIINSPIHKEEYKFGIATPIKKDVNVYIDRGVNAAFERHLILGEINTYQDMENYRNDYFNFAQNN